MTVVVERADFAERRAPEERDGVGMSRFVQLEGRLTLTGANADQRLRVRDSQLAAVASALAHEVVVARGIGPLTADALWVAALLAALDRLRVAPDADSGGIPAN